MSDIADRAESRWKQVSSWYGWAQFSGTEADLYEAEIQLEAAWFQLVFNKAADI